jgi:queuine tRNA-ribosyltransferase
VVDELRGGSSRELASMGFDGYGIGGLSIGESREDMWNAVGGSIDLLPADRPRYLMGVGSPREVLDAISMGVDVFDSAFPTRTARHGTVLTRDGRFDITRGRRCEDAQPLDPACGCRVCREVDRSYVHHLWRSKDTRWMNLLSYHNIALIQDLVAGARAAVLEGALDVFLEDWGLAGVSAQM